MPVAFLSVNSAVAEFSRVAQCTFESPQGPPSVNLRVRRKFTRMPSPRNRVFVSIRSGAE
jgi:hypothetical protein